MEKIIIGKAVNVVGLKGDIKVYNYSDSDEIYRTVEELYVGEKLYKVQNVRLQKHMIVLKLEGIDNRDMAEKLREKDICITEADLPELPEGEFYVRDLIGMTVEEDGNVIGTVSNVLQNTAQDILEVKREHGKNVLIPKVDEFVLDIDAKNRVIKVKLIEGLMEL